jgi:hypothetical protein
MNLPLSEFSFTRSLHLFKNSSLFLLVRCDNYNLTVLLTMKIDCLTYRYQLKGAILFSMPAQSQSSKASTTHSSTKSRQSNSLSDTGTEHSRSYRSSGSGHPPSCMRSKSRRQYEVRYRSSHTSGSAASSCFSFFRVALV